MTVQRTYARTAVAAVAAVTLLAGCASSGGGPSGSATTAATGAGVSTAAAAPSGGASGSGTASGATTDAAFCTTLGDYARKFKSISLSGKVADVRKALPPLVDSGKKAANGAPNEIKGDVTALVGDIAAINTWVQTKATDKQLSGQNVPSEVAKPFADLQKRLPTLASWYSKHCTGTFGS